MYKEDQERLQRLQAAAQENNASAFQHRRAAVMHTLSAEEFGSLGRQKEDAYDNVTAAEYYTKAAEQAIEAKMEYEKAVAQHTQAKSRFDLAGNAIEAGKQANAMAAIHENILRESIRAADYRKHAAATHVAVAEKLKAACNHEAAAERYETAARASALGADERSRAADLKVDVTLDDEDTDIQFAEPVPTLMEAGAMPQSGKDVPELDYDFEEMAAQAAS